MCYLFRQGWSAADPFCGDDAAQHHLLTSGWVWMLRMDNGVTSVGLVEPCKNDPSYQNRIDTWSPTTASEYFSAAIRKYPSIEALMRPAQLIAPAHGLGVGGRMSRCRKSAAGPGWALLPVTYGFVDPLHSTGIAHSLSGVQRVAEILLDEPQRRSHRWEEYSRSLREEIEWIDTLVAGCYLTQPSFQDFVAFASFYFIAAIEFEKQLAADPSTWPLGFLQAGDARLRTNCRLVLSSIGCEEHACPTSELGNPILRQSAITEAVRRGIEPWNRVGLLDPDKQNRISHSAAPKYAAIALGKS
jgi:tetracycline 7-halogenase / FADH2 O2-dependent halogenase